MLKLLLIQRNGATTHRVLDKEIRYHDFVEMVSFENFGQELDKDESKSSIYVPHSNTTYTLLAVYGATANELQINT